MKWFDRNGNWAVPVLWIVFALGWLVAWIDYYFDSSSFCLDSEAGAVCAREWFGALSGWFAAIAAIITIYFLYRQNEEQRKQSDFLLGESRPTIDALRHLHRPEDVVIRIVNWNRRPILLLSVRLPNMPSETVIKTATIRNPDGGEGLKPRRLIAEQIVEPIPMPGWKNRSKSPAEVRIDIEARAGAHKPFETEWKNQVVQVGVFVAGEEGYEITLECPIAVVN